MNATCFPTLTWSFIWTLSYLYHTPTILCPLVSSSAPLTPPPPPLHHTVHMFHPSLDTLHYNTVPSSSFHSFKAGRQACRQAGLQAGRPQQRTTLSPTLLRPSFPPREFMVTIIVNQVYYTTTVRPSYPLSCVLPRVSSLSCPRVIPPPRVVLSSFVFLLPSFFLRQPTCQPTTNEHRPKFRKHPKNTHT